MMRDLSYTAPVPFFTVCGTLKALQHQIDAKTGPFGPKEQMTEEDAIKKSWMDTSLVRTAEFIKDMNFKESLEDSLIKVDPSLPPIPCCCFWLN
jgi:hypothetical protein